MKKVGVFIVLFFTVCFAWSQDLVIQSINEITNPNHRDNIGNWQQGDVFTIKGTYSAATVTSVKIRLITFAKGTWVDPLELYNIDIEPPFTGELNHTLQIPENYRLAVNEGEDANTQILQVSATYNGHDSQLYNYYLNVIEPRKAALIDFDELYTTASGTSLVNNINSALENAIAGDTLLFKSEMYDFEGKSLHIDKEICITGKQPVVTQTSVGTYSVQTFFKNLKNGTIRSNNVSILNLGLQAITEPNYVFIRISGPTYGNENTGEYYKNILFSNVELNGGKVQVYGGNGADVVFNQVSFVNFADGGYFLNRKGRIGSAPKFIIQNSFFKPNFDEVNYNVRGISLDAGNDEYPVVWNQNESTIINCLLDGTGLGISSKCSYVNVKNNHFKGYRKDVDMIHIEEFGHHFLIDGNTFEHISPARGIYIDRETQQCHDITITNNKWIGEYAWIISANAPYNLVMENNDFSQAYAKNTSDKTIDFTYYHGNDEGYLQYELPSENIVFKNNTGLTAQKDGVFSYKLLSGDTSLEVEYPESKIEKTEITEAPQSILDTNKKYRIKNNLTGEYLTVSAADSKLTFNANIATDQSDIWELSFKYPYYHNVKNAKTGKHIEVYRGYTLGDINNGTDETIFVEHTYEYSSNDILPFWYFREHNLGTSKVYEIFPGGNERKSRMLKQGDYAEIEIARENNEDKELANASAWILETVEGELSTPLENTQKVKAVYNSEKKEIQIKSIHQQTLELTLMSITGNKLVSKKLNNKNQNTSINTSKFTSGVYMLVLVVDGEKSTTKLALF
ncbi:hypothetical protein FHR24_001331 [Wenyingzhuangia heitensis]|uniref:Secretion system C-terminal sorting domain-containing protein n=1 Tax=Wenyingzhuangia heitensis TaxID=1487859 RepID=A0ABX0U7U7_9FLAO|nr:T9SS type A sorting domain-containing protein [Wenyingzhuangia heitensis]NIJ44892.1 hypothetical protein [Wenyingzhuangia heitensis]